MYAARTTNVRVCNKAVTGRMRLCRDGKLHVNESNLS